MKRTFRPTTIVAVALLLLLAAASGAAASPAAPDWAASSADQAATAGHVPAPVSGHIPAPNDLSYLSRTRAVPRSRVFKSYPASFDLRALGRVTPVKDQKPYGTCWAFAGLGSLESGLLAADPAIWDFSEDNLAWFSGFSISGGPYGGGGNSFMALAYLARRSGPVDEADDPYADGAHPRNVPAQRHLTEAVFLPPRTSATDNDAIKDAVMRYGAVDVDMWWPDQGLAAYWNEATDSLYVFTPDLPEEPHTANHDVLVVGWDDAYPKSRFATEPPGPGAFLVKNSWGAAWGDQGYFWVSYYDTTFAHGGYNVAFAAADSPAASLRVYQYDPLGFWPQDGPYVDGTTSWFANVFTAKTREDLGAVGFYTPLADCAYEVFTSATSGRPSLAGLTSRAAGTIATPGYHVVPLSAAVPLKTGRPFTIAVRLTVPTAYHYPIPVERPYPGYSDATAAAGQSYVCRDGSTWQDLTTLKGYAEANVCLKGFTTGQPYGTFRVDDGEEYTNSTAVTLHAGMSAAADMRFRNAGGAWTQWQPFAATSAWPLPAGDGPKTVEAEFRNAQGTATRTDRISLDTVRPKTQAPYKASVRRGGYVRLLYKVTDRPPCAARATVTINIRKLGGASVKIVRLERRDIGTLQSYRFRCWLAKRTYRFYVYASDAAGNGQSVIGRNYLTVR